MKYIVMQVKKPGGFCLNLPFIFPDAAVHAVVAEGMKAALAIQWPDTEITVLSAGMCNSMDIGVSCYGNSESLKLESREEIDDNLIQYADYGSTLQ